MKRLFSFPVIVFMLMFSQGTVWARSVMPGSSRQECALCHYEWHPDHQKKENPSRIPRYIGRKRFVTNEWICYSCHDGSMLDSRAKVWEKKITHPTLVVPSSKITLSDKYPLYFLNNFASKDAKGVFYGELDCGSCHTAHAIGTQDGYVPERATYLREKNVNSEMCVDCHADKTEGAKEGMHPINVDSIPFGSTLIEAGSYSGDKPNKVICESCHKVHSSGSEKLLTLPAKGSHVFASELCEACHTDNPSKKGSKNHDSHPVDILPKKATVPEVWPSGKLSNTGQNQRLICLSCHSPHGASKGTHLLVENNDNSSFCQICHADKTGDGTGEKNQGTHPVNIQLTKDMRPENLRIGRDTKVICETCHKVHNAANNSANDGTDGKIMAISNKNGLLCKECHDKKYAFDLEEGIKKGTHPINVVPYEANPSHPLLAGESRLGVKGMLVCESCHKIHGATPETKNLLVKNTYSELCNTCHENKITIKIGDIVTLTRHQCSVQFLSERVKVADKVFKVGGRLGENKEAICNTCHRVHRAVTNTPLLLLENKQSSFCFECHPDLKSVLYSDHNLSITAPEETNLRKETVEESGVCGACHFSHGWAKALSGKGNYVTQLCLSCHNKKGSASEKTISDYTHPTGKPISNADGSSSLPLFDELGLQKTQGNVLCTSCHDPHRWDPNRVDRSFKKNREGDTSNSFLRKVNDEKDSLCKDCHENKFLVENTEHDLSITAPETKNIDGKTTAETGVCSACHLVHNGKGRKIWAREIEPLGENTSADLCFSCHSEGNPASKKKIVTFTHPTGKSILPADGDSDLPLYNDLGEKTINGKVFCNTCHDPHVWDPVKKKANLKKNIEGDQSNSFLRLPNFPQPTLCQNCHENKVLVERTDHDLINTAPNVENFEGDTRSSGGLCSPCHVVHNGLARRIWARKLSGNGNLSSQFCFSCHFDNKPGEKKQVGINSHPVDVPIANVGGKTSLPVFDSLGAKEDTGNVYCYSCHDPHVWDPGSKKKGQAQSNIEGTVLNSFLRLPSDLDATLCRDCHQDKGFIVGSDHDMGISVPKERNVLGQTAADSGPCGACHIPHNSTAKKLWAKKIGEGDDLITALCDSCHNENGCGNNKQIGDTHPTGVAFSLLGLKTPSFLPIFTMEGVKDQKNGKVLCSTCHNVHQWEPDKRQAGPGVKTEGNAENSFLRIYNKNSELCIACHSTKRYVINTEHDLRVTAPEEKNVVDQTATEAGPCSACHTPHNAFFKSNIWSKVPQMGPESASMLCKSCHSPEQCASTKVPVVATHPLEIVVTNLGRWIERAAGALPVFDKDTGQRVTSGIISCASCHNPHQWKTGDPNEGPGKNIEGNASNSFLRQKDFSLCADCHRFDALFRYKYYHVPKVREIGRGLE